MPSSLSQRTACAPGWYDSVSIVTFEATMNAE